MGGSKGQAKVDGEKPMRPQFYIKNYMRLGRAGSRRGCLLHRRVYQMIVHCQMVRTGNEQTVTLSGVSRLHLLIYMYIPISLKKRLVKIEIMNMKENREGYM